MSRQTDASSTKFGWLVDVDAGLLVVVLVVIVHPQSVARCAVAMLAGGLIVGSVVAVHP